ncbi:hypothetical protein JFI11_06025 [Enterococcus faecalis]|uniref:hypothetical protein n=1 Tax=Enterococcus faecalis TaxID=1351 RepID=UPI0018E71D6F|nr:hypothetical protein [Enterococcus faecalis]EIP8071794.1 hypothetical protein [Enterococcus faecalis]MBJ1692479.1 hypothetical protein [Enterococcus faecalis]
MSELTKLQKISALSKDLMNKEMNDTDRFVHLSHIHELAEELQPELNENQQIVLDCLKKHFSNKETKNYPVTAIFSIFTENTEEFSDVELAYSELTMKQEAQVLLAFANWVLEQEEA